MNKPMLFVNSVSVEYKDNKVEVYDSRNAKKKVNRIHRLDDVEAFMKLGKKVFATIMTKHNNIIGKCVSNMGGHTLNNQVLRKLFEDEGNWMLIK